MNFKRFKFTSVQVYVGIIGLIVILIIYAFNNYAKNYLLKINKINNIMLNIEKEEYRLNYYILKNSLFLYSSFDENVYSIKEIKNKINVLKDNLLKMNEPFVLKYLFDYKKSFNKKVYYIYEFQKVNAPVKNSTIFLANLLSKLPELNVSVNYRKKVVYAVSSVYLAKFTNDMSLIKYININYFKKIKFNNKEANLFNQSLILHINVILNNLSKYNIYLNKILNSDSIEKLHKLKQKFLIISNIQISSFTIMGYFGIFVLFALFVALIILIGMVEKDKDLLYELAYIDNVTNIYNRNKYLEDQNKFNAILLLNIDGFKNINDLYGRETGDKILMEVADYLKKLDKNVYRIVADNFAILSKDKNSVETYIKTIMNTFNHVNYSVDEKLDFQISLSAAISEKKPLLKTAEIALHYVKQNKRLKFIEYNDNLDNSEKIKRNIKKSTILSNAINNNRIIPYFQPIVDVKTGAILKYEVLARIDNNGKIESIFPYLEIAKENRMYREITKIIISKSFEMLYNKNIYFSVNLSIEDILDAEIICFLRKKFREFKGIEKYLTFEILESEAVKDYKQVERFIKLMKMKNISFAIDDFGSGYSNLSHIVNLDIDFIKIDGSLIKNIDKDSVSKTVVELVGLFAKRENIKTIAEFVHNKEVFEIVKNLGIDCAQGFYLYEPLSKPTEI
jgi:diguanylate cyclase (GGDEF)-like protein